MFDTTQIVVTALALLFGSVVLGTVGFGIGLTASPILLFVHEPQTVVVILNTASVFLLTLVVFRSRRELPIRELGPIAIAGAFGVPVGVFMLTSLSDTVLRAGIAGLILLMAVAVARDIRLPQTASHVVGPAVGFVVGALVTGLAIGGPLVVLLLMGRGFPGTVVRESTAFYYLVIAVVAVIAYALTGLFTTERMAVILMVSPVMLLGFGVASLIVRRLNEERFRRGVLALIVVTSVAVLGTELLDLQG